VSAFAPNGSTNLSGSGRRARFPRSSRLLRHADFERVYKQGKRHFATHMTVFYLGRTEGEGLRIGFTVGRVLGGAVDRNRMKRRLREAVRLNRPERCSAVDVVINPKKSLLKAEFGVIQKELVRAFAVIQRALPMAASSVEKP
jgi:ribonuclease P protein component